jgi:hypothetical protein
MDLVGLPAETQRAILDGEPQGEEREPISPEQAAINEQLLDILTKRIGREQAQQEDEVEAYLDSLPPEDATFYREVEQAVAENAKALHEQA